MNLAEINDPGEEEAHAMPEHVIRKGRLLYRHRNPAEILTIAWSPDGRHIATGDSTGHIQIWQADTGQQYFVYEVACYLFLPVLDSFSASLMALFALLA